MSEGADLLGADEAFALAERAMRRCDGDEAQITIARERSRIHRYAHSATSQATDVDDIVVDALVVRDGACGSATVHGRSDEVLAHAARTASERAAAIARRGAAAPYPGLPQPGERIAAEGAYDAATAELAPDPAERALAVAARHALAVGGAVFGLHAARAIETAVASSGGARLYERRTAARLKLVTRIGAAAGYACADARAVSELDADALGRRAADVAFRCLDPVPVPPGRHPAVLAPAALGALLMCWGAAAFNGLARAEGRGPLAGRQGERFAAPCIEIADDPGHARTLARRFDEEGVTARRVALVERGVAGAPVHDVRSAALAGAVSTGHALAPGGDLDGPGARHLVMGGGAADDLDELASTIERGLMISRLWYLSLVDASAGVVSANAREGTFLVEDGRIARAARDLRLLDSVATLLSGVEDLTREVALVGDDHIFGRPAVMGTALVPAIRTRAIEFAGGTNR